MIVLLQDTFNHPDGSINVRDEPCHTVFFPQPIWLHPDSVFQMGARATVSMTQSFVWTGFFSGLKISLPVHVRALYAYKTACDTTVRNKYLKYLKR